MKMNPAKRFLIGAALAIAFGAQAHEIEPGKAVPNCKLAPLGNGPGQDLGQYKGKVLYVDFWASWCGPCAQSFPFMNKLDKELRNRGLQVVGINLDEDPEDAKAFLDRHPAGFVNLTDASGGQCPQEFGVMGMPSSFLVDRNGVIRHVHVGFRPGEAEKFRALVEQLLADEPLAKN
jgi:thiol-disulfide isomerase/thioredoxin